MIDGKLNEWDGASPIPLIGVTSFRPSARTINGLRETLAAWLTCGGTSATSTLPWMCLTMFTLQRATVTR